MVKCLKQGTKNRNSVLNSVGKSAIFVLNGVRVWWAGPHLPTQGYIESPPPPTPRDQTSWRRKSQGYIFLYFGQVNHHGRSLKGLLVWFVILVESFRQNPLYTKTSLYQWVKLIRHHSLRGNAGKSTLCSTSIAECFRQKYNQRFKGRFSVLSSQTRLESLANSSPQEDA